MNKNNIIKKLRTLIKDQLQKHMYESALFLADKLITISSKNIYIYFFNIIYTTDFSSEDTILLAQCYFYTHQFKRCNHLLKNSSIWKNEKDSYHLLAIYLSAKCCVYFFLKKK